MIPVFSLVNDFLFASRATIGLRLGELFDSYDRAMRTTYLGSVQVSLKQRRPDVLD